MAKELQPSLITLDIMMPGLDGWEVLKRLKASNDTCDIPIIAISNVNNKNKSRALGAIDSIAKPISKDELKSLISKYFNTQTVNSALIIDDEEDVRELISDYIEEDIKDIKQASDGRIALNFIENGFIPNIIYLDLMMPNMSGFEFLQLARSNPKLEKTHIVVVTAKELTKEDLKILEHNNVTVVSKGGNIEAIIKEFAKNTK